MNKKKEMKRCVIEGYETRAKPLETNLMFFCSIVDVYFYRFLLKSDNNVIKIVQ